MQNTQKVKVNYFLDPETADLIKNIKKETGLSQTQIITFLINKHGQSLCDDLKKYQKRKEKSIEIYK